MASVKIVLRKKQSKDGTFPLAVRVTKDRKTTYLYLGQTLLESQWDETTQRVKKSHPNSQRLNNFLLKKLAEANDTLLEMQTQTGDVSSHAVKQNLKPRAGVTFMPQADQYLETLLSTVNSSVALSPTCVANQTRIHFFRACLVGTHHPSDSITI